MAQPPTPDEFTGLLRMPGSRPATPYVLPGGGDTSDAVLIAVNGAHRRRTTGAAAAAILARHRSLAGEAVNANALIHARLIGARDRYVRDPDPATVQARWADEAKGIAEDGLARISHKGLRDRVAAALAPALAYERAAMQQQALRAVVAQHAMNRNAMLRNLVQRMSLDPGDILLGGGIDACHAMIDDAAGRGYVTADEALAEKRRGALALCEGTYAAMARHDPARALRELHGEAGGHPLLVHLPQARKEALIEAARTRQAANAIDADLAARRPQEQARRASDEAEAAIVAGLVGDDRSVTANAILDTAVLSAEAQARLLGALARRQQPEPTTQASSATAVALLDAIRRAAGDPSRITSLAPLVAAYSEGRLSTADLRYLAQQLAGAGTPEGEALARRRHDVVNSCKPLIAAAGSPGRRDQEREDAAR